MLLVDNDHPRLGKQQLMTDKIMRKRQLPEAWIRIKKKMQFDEMAATGTQIMKETWNMNREVLWYRQRKAAETREN